MFTKLRCKRFRKEQSRREAEIIRLMGEIQKLTRRIRITAIEQRTGVLSYENARLHSRTLMLLDDATDIARDMKTAGTLHKMNCSNH